MSSAFETLVEKGLTDAERRIKEKIRYFDIASLLKVLQGIGYKAKDLYFTASTRLTSSSSLCEDILFFEQEYPRVAVVVNLGLLAGNSPLPTFFRKKMDAGSIDPILFARFLSFFDHYMTSVLLSMNMPEENGWFFSDWKKTLGQYLNFLALNSVSTLWLLCGLCFPELQVEVVKFPRVLQIQSSSTRLGTTLLGHDSFLGKSQKLTVSSFKVILKAEEIDTDREIPWPVEIKKRLKELIFPVMARINVYLQVVLVVTSCRDITRLSPNSHLGYRSLGSSSKPLALMLFSGYPK